MAGKNDGTWWGRRGAEADTTTAPEFRERVFTGAPSTTPPSARPTIPLPRRAPAAAAEPAEQPPRQPPAPDAGRVVLIYEQHIRRPWRLLGFTAVIVSLTIGVVLGQTEAYRTNAPRPVATAQAADSAAAAPSGAVPTVAAPLTAPRGTVKQRRLEITGAATTLRIRTADLGESLFTVTALDPNVTPQMTDAAKGSVLALAPGAIVTAGADVVLNSTVAWTLRLTDGANELDVDSTAGGLAGFELAGGVARGVLQLPQPKGTVRLAVTGALGDLTVRTAQGAPVRVRLGKGAGSATINGAARRDVKPGTILRETGWAAATGRYDTRIYAEVKTVLVERAPTDR